MIDVVDEEEVKPTEVEMAEPTAMSAGTYSRVDRGL